MVRLTGEAQPTPGKRVILASCLLLCLSVLSTRLVSSAKNGTVPQEKGINYSKIVGAKNSTFSRAYIAWHCEHDYQKSRDLYRQVFTNTAVKPSMHVAYADMLTQNGEKEEALREYQIGFARKSGAQVAETYNPLVMMRYATICRNCKQDDEADWAEQQIVLMAGNKYPGYPRVTKDQLAILPVHAMAELAKGLELQARGEEAQAHTIFRSVARANPDLAVARSYFDEMDTIALRRSESPRSSSKTSTGMDGNIPLALEVNGDTAAW